jgi:hypothetical protein
MPKLQAANMEKNANLSLISLLRSTVQPRYYLPALFDGMATPSRIGTCISFASATCLELSPLIRQHIAYYERGCGAAYPIYVGKCPPDVHDRVPLGGHLWRNAMSQGLTLTSPGFS